MNNITKVSEITVEDIAEYLRLSEYLITGETTDPDDPDKTIPVYDTDIQNTLNTLLNVSKAYIMGYTGHTIEELDNYQDFIIVVLVLCQDMWDNRVLYVDTTNLNHVVTGILDLYSVNLL